LLLADGVRVDDEQLSQAAKLKTIGDLGGIKGHINKNICTEKGIVIFDDKKYKRRNAEFIPKRMADFSNNGDTYMSRNFPNLIVPRLTQAHRLLHIHKNVPGIMAQINNVYADKDINNISQSLMTKGELGYAVTDIHTAYDRNVLKQLKQIDNTIKFRILYK